MTRKRPVSSNALLLMLKTNVEAKIKMPKTTKAIPIEGSAWSDDRIFFLEILEPNFFMT